MEIKGERVAFYTLGCKLNFAESSTLAREFVERGFQKVNPNEIADIYVINTCSVTEQAEKKCRNIIRRLQRQNSDAIIAVTGCYAQLNPQEILEIEGVDLVLGTDHKSELFMRVADLNESQKRGVVKNSTGRAFSCAISEVESLFPAYSSDERSRSFLKIQDGCDYNCSYCTIPLARGASRNLPISLLVKEGENIASKGIKEIVLTGVNSGDFGRTTGETLIDLLKELAKIEGIERIRVSSIEPNLLTEEIIKLFAADQKFLPHFHLPLQSGSNTILAAMRRRYRRELFKERVEMIRESLPFAFIGVDLIVGFPGESSALFEESYNFIKELSPSFLHLFPYSKRANTDAASYSEQVDTNEKNRRVKKMAQLSESLYSQFVAKNSGRDEWVLIESSTKGGKMQGYSRNYIRVELDLEREMIGEIVKVKL